MGPRRRRDHFDRTGGRDSLNGHYIRETDDVSLAGMLKERLEAQLGFAPDAAAMERLERAMPGLKSRAKTLNELSENAAFYVAKRPLAMTQKAAALLTPEAHERLGRLHPRLEALGSWQDSDLEAAVRAFAEAEGVKLGQVAQPLRAALTGSTTSPGIFEVMAVLGRDEALARIAEQAK
jgi:glutamyl-tRNA synthetase